MPSRLLAAWALVGVNLLAGADVHAATFEISATTNLANANYVQWNPLEKWGLSTSKSLALDSSETYDVGPYNTGEVDNSLGEYYVHVVPRPRQALQPMGPTPPSAVDRSTRNCWVMRSNRWPTPLHISARTANRHTTTIAPISRNQGLTRSRLPRFSTVSCSVARRR